MSRDPVRASKLLSYLLRHHPEAVGLSLDKNGWVEIDALLSACRRHGHDLDRRLFERVVAGTDKRRLELSDDGRRVRAAQGHSLAVDLALRPSPPPERLYHGTVKCFLGSILAQGLRPGGRTHVHLSADVETARTVGGRRGRPVVLEVAAGELHRAGSSFYLASNGVWLVAQVPPDFLTVLEAPGRSASDRRAP